MNDISIVLNVHNESLYINSTLKSLSDAADVAKKHSINVEIVIVLDNSDEATIQNVVAFNFGAFSKFQIFSVSFGSLAESRNYGIKETCGEFVYTADADDLISKNSLIEFLIVAKNNNQSAKFAVFTNFLVAFGDEYYVAEFSDSSRLNLEDFIAGNPYVSRIFARRETLISYPYRHPNIENGFAYEDWDLLNQLYADDFHFCIAPKTMLFYRIRTAGILQTLKKNGKKLPLRSKLHHTDYINQTLKSQRFNNSFTSLTNHQQMQGINLANKICTEMDLVHYILDAIELEPTILFDLINNSKDYSPYPVTYGHWAKQMISMCRMLGSDEFTEIFIAQTLNPGGAEKFILQILKSIKDLEHPNSKILVVTTSDASFHTWANKISSYATVFDLRNSFPDLNDSELQLLLINALLTKCPKKARIHFKTSDFGQDFLHNYGNILSENFQVFYYRFSDSNYKKHGRELRDGHIVSFLRQNIKYISQIITDNEKIIEFDKKILGIAYSKKYKTINSHLGDLLVNWIPGDPKYRLLWASRISSEKKPKLIFPIVEKLREFFPNLTMDVYGHLDLSDVMASINSSEFIEFKGSFSDFGGIDINEYDLLVYTSEFDGAPNILIEAASSGIPIVAPDIGGISTIFDSKIVLIPTDVEDEQISEQYVQEIMNLYSNWDNTTKKFMDLKDYIRTKYSYEKQVNALDEIIRK